jgi:hypothetical protein
MEASSGLTEKFLNTIQDNLLTQIEDEPTRGNNILDLAFVSDPSFVEDFKLGKRHGQLWTRYKSVTKATLICLKLKSPNNKQLLVSTLLIEVQIGSTIMFSLTSGL